MFTGLIEDIGTVRGQSRRGDGSRIVIETALDLGDVQIGDSIAVNGACLTAVALDSKRFSADVSAETLARTNLGVLKVGARVHLERALRMGDRLGGHLVQGHVDGVGTLVARREVDACWDVDFELPESLMLQVVEKGSITLDGVSLTVAKLDGRRVTIAVVPHTAQQTLLTRAAIGAPVNVETDLIGKYVQRVLSRTHGGDPEDKGLSADALKAAGFLP